MTLSIAVFVSVARIDGHYVGSPGGTQRSIAERKISGVVRMADTRILAVWFGDDDELSLCQIGRRKVSA